MDTGGTTLTLTVGMVDMNETNLVFEEYLIDLEQISGDGQALTRAWPSEFLHNSLGYKLHRHDRRLDCGDAGLLAVNECHNQNDKLE